MIRNIAASIAYTAAALDSAVTEIFKHLVIPGITAQRLFAAAAATSATSAFTGAPGSIVDPRKGVAVLIQVLPIAEEPRNGL